MNAVIICDQFDFAAEANAALAEAAEAHLMVLAVRQVQSLSPWLVD